MTARNRVPSSWDITDVDDGWGSALNAGWRGNRDLPITYQFEFDFGSLQRSSGRRTHQSAFYQEIDWVAYNGVILLLAHDWSDPDREIVDDEDHRLQLGIQLSPITGVTVDSRFRVLMSVTGKAADTDLFIQVHLWQ
jgi:hypothetical protein